MSAGAHHSLALTAQSEVCVQFACEPAEGVWCYGMQMSSGMMTVDYARLETQHIKEAIS